MNEKYKCIVCGYIYESKLGDPISGILEGTPFSELPPKYLCPICGAGLEDFEKIEE